MTNATNTTTASGAADIASRLRTACTSVRSKSYPRADLIPLMQQAADALASTPQPTRAQAVAVPLDEARRLFDAGWKAAALFCDREDVVADGIIGFGACPQFEAAFSAVHGIKGDQHGTE